MTVDWPSLNRSIDAAPLRGTRRDAMFVKASLQPARTGHAIDIVIRNISAGGLLADSPQQLEIGDEVVVTLRKVGAVPGRVVWVQAGRFGMAFSIAIDPQDVRKPVTVRRRSMATAPARRSIL